MKETLIETISRQDVIRNIDERLIGLMASGYPTNPEIYLLRRARTLEKKVLTFDKHDGDFSTGFAGRKGISWKYDKESNIWSGQLYNRESGRIKAEGEGSSAEAMLRQLMPTQKKLTI